MRNNNRDEAINNNLNNNADSNCNDWSVRLANVGPRKMLRSLIANDPMTRLILTNVKMIWVQFKTWSSPQLSSDVNGRKERWIFNKQKNEHWVWDPSDVFKGQNTSGQFQI